MVGAVPIPKLLLAVLVLAGVRTELRAAWITVQNDTKCVIIVQCTETVNGQVKRGKPIRLLPGESVKECHQPPGVTLDVYNAQNPNKPVLSTPLVVKAENQKFSVAPAAGGVVVTDGKK
jgi:hypothetical protein